MKTTILKISAIILLISLMGTGCEKDEGLPPYHAKGKIIDITGGCYGEIVLIEVEKPKGIGFPGTFSYEGKENESITYKNAIGVPYFSKIGISDSIPQTKGTWLYFEYRERTEEEMGQSSLFAPDPPVFCTANIGPPSANPLLITKIINYK
jgi:hypothetical protein